MDPRKSFAVYGRSVKLMCLINKVFISLIVGFFFVQNNIALKSACSLVYILLFILSSPIGYVLGSGIGWRSSKAKLAFMGIGGGAVVYLACMELFIREFKNSHDIGSTAPDGDVTDAWDFKVVP